MSLISSLLVTDYFIFFFVVVALSVIVVSEGFFSDSDRLDRQLYCLFGAILVGFSVLRPVGMAMDDHGYAIRFSSICPLSECQVSDFFHRDFLWDATISVLKEIYPHPKVMLWLSGFGVMIKLFIVYLLSVRKLLALYAYMAVFYLVTDVTAFRISYSEMFYLVALYYLGRDGRLQAGIALGASAMAHLQGILGCIMLVKDKYRISSVALIFLILVPVFLLLVGIYPRADLVREMIGHSLSSGFLYPSHFSEVEGIKYLDWKLRERSVPVVIPFIMLYLAFVVIKVLPVANRSVQYAMFSVVLASIFMWALGFNQTLQFRVSSFFLVPMVLIAGHAPVTRGFSIAGIMVFSLFVWKYNVAHPMLFDSSNIHVVVVGEGGVSVSYNPECQYECRYDMTKAALVANPRHGNIFLGWSGPCTIRTSDLACLVGTRSQAMVVAKFVKAHHLRITKTGTGEVVSDQGFIRCGLWCEKWIEEGTIVNLGSNPWDDPYFKVWRGACSGGRTSTCQIIMDSDKEVIADFY